MRVTIRQQTLLLAILPMFMAVILLDSYFLYSHFNSIETGMTERAQTLAKQIGSAGEFAFFSGNLEQLQKNATAALIQKDIVTVLIENPTGQRVALAGEEISESDRESIKGLEVSGLVINASGYFWVREPIYLSPINLADISGIANNPENKLLGFVFIKISKTRLQHDKLETIEASLFISIVLIFATYFFVQNISRRIVNPINALNKLIHGIREGNLDKRISPLPVISELNELAQGVNETAKRLKEDRTVLDEHIELLRHSQERLNNIIEMMPVALFIKDSRSRITLMNNACELQWGVLFSSVAGTDGSRFFPPEQMQEFLENDRKVFAGRKMVNAEEMVWNSEIKENRTLNTFKKPIYGKDGEPLYLLCISVDISERKQAEYKLNKLNEQLEIRIESATRELRVKKDDAVNANYDKTRFLATASHDLRQPMHALGLFVGELQSKLTTDEQRHLVGKVEESVNALSNLLDALLDISKLDAGTIDIRIRKFPIGELLARLANDYIPLARKNGVTLKLVTTDAIVNSDPILLERMLINLIVNAIRYTPVGGRVLVGCRLRGDRLRIEVRDNGIGISVHDQTRIFREFIQLANPERDREKGLGLGLAIVDRIAKLLKHHVTLRSEINKGSTFAVYVPRMVGEKYVTKQDMQVKEITSARQNSVGLENLNVLVVEDDALVRKSTQGILESWGCRVSIASCFNDIKQVHNDANFDLVICDYRLPDGDGIQVKKWIWEYFANSPMFILITGDISPDILRMVRENNIDLLHKPVRPAKLRSLIQFLLSQNTLS